MNQAGMQHSSPESELTLKELILRIQSTIKYLFTKLVTILIAACIGAALGLILAIISKQQYVADTTFVLEDSKSSPLGAYAGIASQFGIDLGGGGGDGVFTGDNILEFLKSRLMIEKTLLSSVKYHNKSTSLAEVYIDVYKLRESWEENPNLLKMTFPATADRAKFNRQQDSILQSIYSIIVKKNLTVDKIDKKLSFISVKCKSQSEFFSKEFAERLVKEATEFYVTTKTKRSKATVDKLQAKADSLEDLLNKKSFSVASAQDLNLNPAKSIARVGIEVGQRDKMVLQTMYAEVVKNLEISKMSMAQETPIIQLIDTPILPLRKEKIGKTKSVVVGGTLAGLLAVFLLLLKKAYNQIMQ